MKRVLMDPPRAGSRGTARFFASVEYPNQREVDPRVRYPAQYLDVAAFQRGLREKSQRLSRTETLAVRREFAKPPPRGWDVKRFLEEIRLFVPSSEEPRRGRRSATRYKEAACDAAEAQEKLQEMVSL